MNSCYETSCQECEAISRYGCDPRVKTFFSPACLYCGARAIQRTQRVMRLGRQQTIDRCRQHLQRWLEFGHDESAIRELAKQADWSVAPHEKGRR